MYFKYKKVSLNSCEVWIRLSVFCDIQEVSNQGCFPEAWYSDLRRDTPRKDMRFNATTMSYTGHTDFGCEVKAPHQVADHGLVFTFHSFGENHPQPVVVCASHGPTKGTVLAQLIVKAILLLEDVAAYVDAIVCDDATTNRSVLK